MFTIKDSRWDVSVEATQSITPNRYIDKYKFKSWSISGVEIILDIFIIYFISRKFHFHRLFGA